MKTLVHRKVNFKNQLKLLNFIEERLLLLRVSKITNYLVLLAHKKIITELSKMRLQQI